MAFQFTVPDVAGATPAAMANARGPDYLVSIPVGHALFGIGAAYFRPGGAAVPGAAAGAAPVRDSIPLRTLEGLFGSCVVVPDDDDGPRFGTHAIQPALLGRVADRCVAAGAGGLFDLGSFINLVRELARDGGVLANAADFVELAPFGIPGAVGERPAVPAQWTPSFALANISISRFRDVSGCAAAYAYLRLASGVAGIAAERRGDAFSNAGRMLSGLGPRVGVVAVDAWPRDRIADAIEWMVQSQWPPELCALDVFSSSARGLADLSARAAFFSGEQVKCERVVRSRSPVLFAALPALKRILGNSSEQVAWQLAVQLAQRLEPNCDASSLPLWRRVDRRLSELSGVLLEDGGVADPAAAVQRILDFVDTRAVHSGGGAAGPALLSGGASGGSGVAGRGRTLAVIDVLSAPSVAGVGGLLAKLRAAVGVSSAEVLSVAAGSKLQPLIKYIFRDQKAPLVHEVFNILNRALNAKPSYVSLQPSVDDDGNMSGPHNDPSLARAKKFIFSDAFLTALQKGDFVSCLDLSVGEFVRWYASFSLTPPNAVSVVDATARFPSYITFMDRAFSSLGYDRRDPKAPDGPGFSVGDILSAASLFKLREPVDGYHDEPANTFIYAIAKLSAVEYTRFVDSGNCDETLPVFAFASWEPFQPIAAKEKQSDGLRDLNDYIPGIADFVLSTRRGAQPSPPPHPQPKKPKPNSHASLCPYPGCSKPAYPGYTYCGLTHARAAGAAAPPAVFPVPLMSLAPSPVLPFPTAPAPPTPTPSQFSPFGPSSFPTGFSTHSAPNPFQALPPPFGPPDGSSGKGKGRGRGRGVPDGGRGRGAGRGATPFAPTWASQVRQLRANGPVPPGSLAHLINHSASHVSVHFAGPNPTVADKAKMAGHVGCGPNDRCWALGMCLGTDSASLCEHPNVHQPGCVQHQFPGDFQSKLKRGDFQ